MSKIVKQMEYTALEATFKGVRDLLLIVPTKVDSGLDFNFRKQLRDKKVRVQMVKLGIHFVTDLTSPEAANQGADHQVDPLTKEKLSSNSTAVGESEFKDVAKQWTIGVDIGTIF